jgi:competence protein ComEC
VEKVKTNTGWQTQNAQVLLQFNGLEAIHLQNGDRLLIGKELTEIEKPSIPGQFDAKQYYHRKGINYQVFVSASDFKKVGPPDPNTWVLISHKIRSWMENKINELSIEKNDGFMLSALLLGIRRKIDPELKAAYSAAGVTHILAVSGMHVGLIFGFLSRILGWLKRFKYGTWAFSLTVIALLWLYAMVTGLSPSVLRAVTIFSIIQIGEVFKRPGLPINGLCLGTIILFLFDCEIIYDVGYQLSFAAVYGIISFERPIRDLIKTRKKVTRFLWESCTITIAATLATFPLILYYFHQFPVYFLLANLVAVPISNGLIYAGIALLVASPFAMVAEGVAWVIHASIFCLNQFVLWISKLPFSTLEQIYIPSPSLLLLLGFLIFLQFWILNSRYKMLLNSLLFMLLYALSILFYQTYLWKRPTQTYAIRTKKDWMISTIQGRKATLTLLASDTIKSQNAFEIKSLKEGYHLMEVASFCKKGTVISANKKPPLKQSTLVLEKGKRFLFLGNYIQMDTAVQSKLKIDYLIVQQIGLKTLKNALAGLEPKEIWVDWPGKKVEEWRSQNSNFKMVNFRSNRFQSLE